MAETACSVFNLWEVSLKVASGSALFSLSANTSWPSTCVRPWVWLRRRLCRIRRCPWCSAEQQPCDPPRYTSRTTEGRIRPHGPFWMWADGPKHGKTSMISFAFEIYQMLFYFFLSLGIAEGNICSPNMIFFCLNHFINLLNVCGILHFLTVSFLTTNCPKIKKNE